MGQICTKMPRISSKRVLVGMWGNNKTISHQLTSSVFSP